ncbi:4-hydroxythreonine-4-phosphate dehydrogenase PdxA [Pseudorhodobacter sp.]|uniref:4-hydroxythreonine-4-phosphate dehydrogenase PdxA n=1 Tax=Pseudorhodobacter sp. TaxID=1934400 RepID=UPI0026474390|nr:4-hydroxythreonine-4-phosphate dehydrogenase PdxA [Pseudorhodobacter sp.]MDN5788614.1 4-hydroxythreonine-4-phosphate dehydrogenase PdxA [Pseudorhodobacter sp.]
MIAEKPRLVLTLGDPAGIGSELVARLLGDEDARTAADVLIIGDEAELRDGMAIAGATFEYDVVTSASALNNNPERPLFLPMGTAPASGIWARAEATADGGRHCLETLGFGLDLVSKGAADALVFAPLNKTSLHAAGMAQSDELHWFADRLGHNGTVSEINGMEGLWTSRVTSHVALREVADLITEDKIIEAARLIHAALIEAGHDHPRIGVCGLNPHNGDNGNFGTEEIDIIAPAVKRARALGLPVEGPYPSDTIFLKAVAKELDAIVTLYHDQGQIAIKLLGFWQGVTVQGGLPVPITTPAHGTAFDIRGKGCANVGPMRAAWNIACTMGQRRRHT